MIDTNTVLHSFWFTFAVVAMVVIWKQGRMIAKQDIAANVQKMAIASQLERIDAQKVMLQDAYDTLLVQEEELDEWEKYGDYSESRLSFLEGLTERQAYFYVTYAKPSAAGQASTGQEVASE